MNERGAQPRSGEYGEGFPSVVFVSAELAPIATTGGLGEVSRALPRALATLGHRVSAFLPLYASVHRSGVALETVGEIDGLGIGKFRLFRAPEVLAPASLYLIEHDSYFGRAGLYGEGGVEYGDNLERYAFFSRAVLESVIALGLPADVIHANDWHTGLVPALLRRVYPNHPRLGGSVPIFTVHNLAFQGRFGADRLAVTGLPPDVLHIGGIEYYGGINLMKAGLVFAQAITTVSPRYAEEIRTPEFGEGLDGLLRERGADVHGILNGIDDEEWNPDADRHLPTRYGPETLAGKLDCKRALLAEARLQIGQDEPLAGMVTRLTHQKGSDIVLGVADDLLRLGIALVVLGSGDWHLEQGFQALAGRYPGRVGVHIGYDEPLSHRIEAGADMFLMPSRYEPCGLNQMYSLRYGTVPIVRATGGLDDTVRDPRDDHEHPNGFKFHRPWGTDLVEAVARALDVRRDRRAWERMQQTGMREDFSWRASARKYSELYRNERLKFSLPAGMARG
jgi:starch synthase